MTTDTWPTAEQRANLAQLSAYLRTRDDEMFNMSHFAASPGRVNLQPDSPEVHQCGTVCCAAGSGPAAGVPARPDESWRTYTLRAFGADIYDDESETPAGALFDWLFDGDWRDRDNTPVGAAARIDWFLVYGLPGDIDEQRRGAAPLCYRAG